MFEHVEDKAVDWVGVVDVLLRVFAGDGLFADGIFARGRGDWGFRPSWKRDSVLLYKGRKKRWYLLGLCDTEQCFECLNYMKAE